MLNDTDQWPVTCPNCGKVTHKEIRELKAAVEFTCVHCGSEWNFRNDTFLQVLENLKETVNHVCQSTPLTEKKA